MDDRLQKKICLVDTSKKPFVENLHFEKEIFGPNTELNHMHDIDKDKLKETDVVIVYYGAQLKKELIYLLENCKGIVAATTGFDNIDIAAAVEKKIPVCNIPHYGSEEIADHTLMLMLACARRFTFAQQAIQNGHWTWQSITGVQDLRGKKLGIIGLGHIGIDVAKRAMAFGLEVFYYDPCHQNNVPKNFTKVDRLEVLLKQSDIITIHCPLNDKTYHLLDKAELEMLKPGAILINTSRGEVINQHELCRILKNNQLFAVGLDVLANEPKIPKELKENPRVILTPHCAFYSEENVKRMRALAAKAALNFIEYKSSINSIVNEV